MKFKSNYRLATAIPVALLMSAAVDVVNAEGQYRYQPMPEKTAGESAPVPPPREAAPIQALAPAPAAPAAEAAPRTVGPGQRPAGPPRRGDYRSGPRRGDYNRDSDRYDRRYSRRGSDWDNSWSMPFGGRDSGPWDRRGRGSSWSTPWSSDRGRGSRWW